MPSTYQPRRSCPVRDWGRAWGQVALEGSNEAEGAINTRVGNRRCGHPGDDCNTTGPFPKPRRPDLTNGRVQPSQS